MKKFTRRDVDARLGELCIELVGEYNGYEKSANFRCLECGFQFLSKPVEVVNQRRKCKCKQQKRYHDLTGKRYGNLTVVGMERRCRGIYWKCICDCGKEKTVLAMLLSTGRTRSCGCLQYLTLNNSYSWKGHGEISSKFWHSVLSNAARRKIKVGVSIEDVWVLFLSQDRCCSLTGEPIEFPPTSKKFGTASLDRIDPTHPYVLGNIQWVHKSVNNMKWDLSQSRFVSLCRLVNEPLSSCPSEDCEEFPKFKTWSGYGNICGQLWCRYQQSAKNRGIGFFVSIQDIWKKFLEQDGNCAVTGMPLGFNKKGTNESYRIELTASLDRIDSSFPYALGNIQWVHKEINQKLKKDMDESEMRKWCIRVAYHMDRGHTFTQD